MNLLESKALRWNSMRIETVVRPLAEDGAMVIVLGNRAADWFEVNGAMTDIGFAGSKAA